MRTYFASLTPLLLAARCCCISVRGAAGTAGFRLPLAIADVMTSRDGPRPPPPPLSKAPSRAASAIEEDTRAVLSPYHAGHCSVVRPAAKDMGGRGVYAPLSCATGTDARSGWPEAPALPPAFY